MHVAVHWKLIDAPRGQHEAWDLCRVLYAYLPIRGREVLYIGKADRHSVHQRYVSDDKAKGAFDYLRRERGIERVRVLFGDLDHDGNFSSALLSDVESLLIHRVQPCANIAAKKTRIERPGMRVKCHGAAWTHGTRTFHDT